MKKHLITYSEIEGDIIEILSGDCGTIQDASETITEYIKVLIESQLKKEIEIIND